MATFSELKYNVLEELGGSDNGYSKSEVDNIFKAITTVVEDMLAEGEKVSIPGLVSFKPVYVGAKKKGEMVRNPASGEMMPRPESKPASFRAKATASPSLKKAFPSIKSKGGQRLEGLLKK